MSNDAMSGSGRATGGLRGSRLGRAFSALLLGLGMLTGIAGSVLLSASPASAAQALSCTAPASGGTSQNFVVGTHAVYTVACQEETGISGTAAYPASITLNTGALPADATEATSTSSTPACTHTTSGSGTTEQYITQCQITETPTTADIGTYTATFTATASPFSGSTLTTANSGILTLHVVAPTISCIDPAAAGTATTWYTSSPSNSYTVECESQSGIANVTAYPTSIAIASGALPGDANQTFATSTSSSPACTTGTSGSGTTEQYILECNLAGTVSSADVGSYPFTFTATAVDGATTVTSGTLTVTVSPPTTTCSAPAAGGSSTTFTDGTAGSYTVTCYSQGFSTASAGNYPASITLNSGTLPADASEATSLTSSPACTTGTSGSGVTEQYQLKCNVTETPTAGDNGTYPVTFLATGGTNGAPNVVSGTWTLSVTQPAPTFGSNELYDSVIKNVPFCYNIAVTNAGSLPLTAMTAGATPSGITNYGIQNINLATGTAQLCGTDTNNPVTSGTPPAMVPTASNPGGTASETIPLGVQNECTWTSSQGTVSMFDTNQDIEQTGSQSAFGHAITNGETAGTTTNYATCTGDVMEDNHNSGDLGGAFTTNTANPLPTPTDTNPSAAQGDLPSSNLELNKGCYGSAQILGSYHYGSFGSGSVLTVPSPWVNGGSCSYGGLGSNSAGGNTDSFATCPPTQADVNEGYVDCGIVASSGNDSNGSVNYTADDLFFNNQPVPQQSTATLSAGSAHPGDSISVTGGTNWWGNAEGAPNSGLFGDRQQGAFYQVGAPAVYIGTTRGSAIPVTSSTVTISGNSYVCTGAESNTVGPNPCTMTPGQPGGHFTVPTSLAPGTYNVYIDETNTTPLPGNGPNDSFQTARGTNLGTAESVTSLTVAPNITLAKSTTSTGYGAAGDTIPYNYLVTNTSSGVLTNIAVSDNKIANVSCPQSSLNPGDSETCTATYTVSQADVDGGSVTNTATASGTDPNSNTDTSSTSSVTVLASNATSSLTLVKSTTSSGYGAAGDVLSYSYAVTNTGTTTLSSVAVSDNKVASVSCPQSSLAPGASETCTGSYPVTQADVDTGSVTNNATATAKNPQSATETSNSSSVTVEATGATSGLSLTKSTTSTGYAAAGDTIPYSYAVTNTGTTTLSNLSVSDSLIPSVSCPQTSLAPGATVTCTATYTVTQGDVDSGSVNNTASASATNPQAVTETSNSSSVTVTASGATSSLSLVKSTTSSGFASAGDVINYRYLLTNGGTTTLTGISVSDDHVASVTCPNTTLAPTASETCTGSYTVTQADVDAGSVTNNATASATSSLTGPVTSNTASVTLSAAGASSSLSLAKSTTSTGYGAAGDTIAYSYLLTNTGTTTLHGLGVTDDHVASVSCPSGTLQPGTSATCTGSYTVTQADVDAGSVTNNATASALSPENNSVLSNSDSVTVQASDATSTLSLAKSTTSTGYGAAGDTIAYSYAVQNTGTTTLSNVSVSDNLVASVSCPSGNLAPGASTTCSGTYTVTQGDVDAGSVTNNATASALNPQSATVTSNGSSVTVEASGATGSLSLAKSTTSTGFAAAGDTIAYSYAVTNTGTTTLSSVAVSDNKVASVSCPQSSLAPGASETCTGSYTVTQADVDAGSVTNTDSASATSSLLGTVSATGNSVTVTASGAVSSLSLAKSTTSTGYGAAGDTIAYSYAVTNTGTTTLSSVAVSDNKVASVSCPQSSLAPGASETCTGSYTVTQADVDNGSVTNTATASALNPHDVTETSGSSSVTVDASSATAGLSLTKQAVTASYSAAGDVLHYTYLVSNTGTETLSGISVSDDHVASVSCPNATLAPSASETCTGTYTVTQDDVNAGSVENTATAHGTTPASAPVASANSSVTVSAANCVPAAFLGSGAASALAGQAFSTTVATCSNATPRITVAHLPAGLTLTDHGNGTATIAGTPSATDAGIYTATLTATVTRQAKGTRNFIITVDNPGTLTTAAKETLQVGTPFSYTVTTKSAYPTPAFSSVSGLPAGLSFADNGDGTATISGTPLPGSGGVYPLTLSETNGEGAPVTKALTLTVDEGPAITSANSLSVTAGTAMTPFPVTTTGYPAPSVRTSGLAPGLTYSSATKSISGTPKAADAGHTYTVTITATNSTAAVTQTLTLTVS